MSLGDLDSALFLPPLNTRRQLYVIRTRPPLSLFRSQAVTITTPSIPPFLKVSKSVQKAAGSEGRDAKDMQDHWSVRYRLALLRKVLRKRRRRGGTVVSVGA